MTQNDDVVQEVKGWRMTNIILKIIVDKNHEGHLQFVVLPTDCGTPSIKIDPNFISQDLKPQTPFIARNIIYGPSCMLQLSETKPQSTNCSPFYDL